MESLLPNGCEVARQLERFQGITTQESILSNICDAIGYCDPNQGSTTSESQVLDDANGGMKDDFRDISRRALMIETPRSVDGACEIWNVLRWQVSTQVETNKPTAISISSGDCEGRSADRETEFTPTAIVANVSWVDYHVGMRKLHNPNVAFALFNDYDDHDAAAGLR